MALMVGGAGGRWALTGVLAEERELEGAGAEGLPDCVKRDVVVTERRGGGPKMGPGEAGFWWPGLGGGALGKQPALGLHSHTSTHVCAQQVALSAHGSPSVTFDVTIQLAATAPRGHQQGVLPPPGPQPCPPQEGTVSFVTRPETGGDELQHTYCRNGVFCHPQSSSSPLIIETTVPTQGPVR